MKSEYKSVLFQKHILVNDSGKGRCPIEVIYSLLNLMNIKVTGGFELATEDMIRFCQGVLGTGVLEPFYRGFPKSVRAIPPVCRLLDQVAEYTRTYGFGDFETAGHSLFEEAIRRSPFGEKQNPLEVKIVTEEEAIEILKSYAETYAVSTRPLNYIQLELIKNVTKDYDWFPKTIASKLTACDLLRQTGDMRYADFIKLSDVIKLVDCMAEEQGQKLNKLSLRNQQRKLITKVLDRKLSRAIIPNPIECFEKQATWVGLLHHIHYVAKTPFGKDFVQKMRTYPNYSVNSEFERAMNDADPVRAAHVLKADKGNAALLRNLNYILSRCEEREAKEVLRLIDATNPIVLMQMLLMYRNYKTGGRTFRFVKHNRMVVHKETDDEVERSKSALTEHMVGMISAALNEKLAQALKGRAGKVYIAPGMEKIALPIQMAAGESGFGILPTGSRVKIPECKKVRAFTYWSKVNDIDLACFGIDVEGNRAEFSWRTMWNRLNDAITYSGDVTSGYNGGSEYFDIDITKFKEMYPNMKYLVFTDNVYSAELFKDVECRAGFMNRDILDSGDVYEPKTVKTSYTINAESTFAYLFAIDLDKREIVWLNIADNRRARVAGTTEFAWVLDYAKATEVMNFKKFFEMAASRVVGTPEDADLVIGDIETDKEQIHSYEFEKALKYMQ